MTRVSPFARAKDEGKWREALTVGARRRWAIVRAADIERIKSGDINDLDRERLRRYHRRSVELGEFSGPLYAWLKHHGVALPKCRRKGKAASSEKIVDHQPVEIEHMRACASIAGPEVLWALMVTSGELSPMPNKIHNVVQVFA